MIERKRENHRKRESEQYIERERTSVRMRKKERMIERENETNGEN